tara:strand:- start:197 stop:415 length:219 start_codon:yes stop_codon:yes gene_type:complete
MKIIIIFFLLFMTACSLDTKSGIWNEKKIAKQKSKLINNETVKINQNLTFDEYKLTVIEYGKKSKFPKINNN